MNPIFEAIGVVALLLLASAWIIRYLWLEATNYIYLPELEGSLEKYREKYEDQVKETRKQLKRCNELDDELANLVKEHEQLSNIVDAMIKQVKK